MKELSKHQRDLEQLEHKRQMINDRLNSRRQRINASFDNKKAALNGQLSTRQEAIVEVALGLLSEDGITNLSLRDVAKRLDMQAPAIYWHFKSKEDLVDNMAEAILQKGFKDLKPRQDGEIWQDWLINHMKQLRQAMLAYADGAKIVAGAHLYPAMTLAKSFDTALLSLRSQGVQLTTARHLVTTATYYTFGFVIEEQASPSPEELTNFDFETFLQPYPNMQDALSEAGLMPLSRIHNISELEMHTDNDFQTGLEYIINGSK
jgi:TetR/AcrR family tetracycline transcriptional repressor